MAELWQIETRKPRRFWREYHFVARTQEFGDSFRLECSWEQPVYLLTVYKNEKAIFERWLFADADCDKFVEQIMRIARRNIERKLARVDQLHKDLMLDVSAICRDPK